MEAEAATEEAELMAAAVAESDVAKGHGGWAAADSGGAPVGSSVEAEAPRDGPGTAVAKEAEPLTAAGESEAPAGSSVEGEVPRDGSGTAMAKEVEAPTAAGESEEQEREKARSEAEAATEDAELMDELFG